MQTFADFFGFERLEVYFNYCFAIKMYQNVIFMYINVTK